MSRHSSRVQPTDCEACRFLRALRAPPAGTARIAVYTFPRPPALPRGLTATEVVALQDSIDLEIRRAEPVEDWI